MCFVLNKVESLPKKQTVLILFIKVFAHVEALLLLFYLDREFLGRPLSFRLSSNINSIVNPHDSSSFFSILLSLFLFSSSGLVCERVLLQGWWDVTQKMYDILDALAHFLSIICLDIILAHILWIGIQLFLNSGVFISFLLEWVCLRASLASWLMGCHSKKGKKQTWGFNYRSFRVRSH